MNLKISICAAHLLISEIGFESHVTSNIKYCLTKWKYFRELLKDIKVNFKGFRMWLISKMLGSTLLVILLSSMALSKNPAGFCGCPLDTVESYNEERIPAKITEWICHQDGAPCGGANMSLSTVSIRNYLRKLGIKINTFYSATK